MSLGERAGLEPECGSGPCEEWPGVPLDAAMDMDADSSRLQQRGMSQDTGIGIQAPYRPSGYLLPAAH